MEKKEVKIKNELGLNIKQGNELLDLCSSFESEVELETVSNKKIKVDSILKILSLGVKKGESIVVTTNGTDESLAIEKLIYFFENLKD